MGALYARKTFILRLTSHNQNEIALHQHPRVH
jgi:hypothetical protein